MNLTPDQYKILYGEAPPKDRVGLSNDSSDDRPAPLTFDAPPRAYFRRKTYSRSTSTALVPYQGPTDGLRPKQDLKRVLIPVAIFISLALSPLLVLLIDREPDVEVLSQSVNAVEPSNLDQATNTSVSPSALADSPLLVSQSELDDANAALASAVIGPLDSTDGLDRADYIPAVWPDTDDDCQSDREEVLIEESISQTELSLDTCRVTGGSWIDPFDGQEYDNLDDLIVTQLVPIEHAHQAGAAEWSGAQRRAFTVDAVFGPSLIVASEFLVDERGSQGPHLWEPAPLAQCRYAVDWIAVKSRWSLRFSEDEVEALAEMLDVCNSDE